MVASRIVKTRIGLRDEITATNLRDGSVAKVSSIVGSRRDCGGVILPREDSAYTASAVEVYQARLELRKNRNITEKFCVRTRAPT